jgi:hypothetical protein
MLLRILCLGHCALLVGGGKIHSVPGASVEGDFGTTAGKWLGALLGMLVLGGIGSILGAVVWYTRPSRGSRIISAKIAMLEADLQIKESLWTWLTGSNDLSAGY